MEVAAFVISIVALAVAVVTLPTVFQMWFGRPLLNIKVQEHNRSTGQKDFMCEIYSSPVDFMLLRKIGVTRDDITVGAGFEVSEFRTKKMGIIPLTYVCYFANT